MVRRDAVGDVLQQHRLAGSRRRDDEAALPLADRDHQVHDARGEVVGRRFEVDAVLRIERRQVLEEDLLARLLGRLEVDRLDLDQREVALAFLRRPDLSRHRVAGVQIELAYLRRGDVDVVGAGQVVVVGGAQEPEAVRQRFEHPFREQQAALLGARSQDLEDQLLLPHAGRAGHVELLGDLGELGHAHVFERRELDDHGAPPPAGAGFSACHLSLALATLAISLHNSSNPSPPVAETGKGALPNTRSSCLRFRTRSARESLSTFVATMSGMAPTAESHRVRLHVRVQPRVTGVDQQERRAASPGPSPRSRDAKYAAADRASSFAESAPPRAYP